MTEVISSTMLCLRRIPRRFLRTFSSSAVHHEIRDISALSQRLLPKFQGSNAPGTDGGQTTQDKMWLRLTPARIPGRTTFSPMARASTEHPVGSQGLRSSGD